MSSSGGVSSPGAVGKAGPLKPAAFLPALDWLRCWAHRLSQLPFQLGSQPVGKLHFAVAAEQRSGAPLADNPP